MLGDDQTQRPNIRTTLDLLRRRWKVMVPFLLLPVLVFALSASQEKKYEASATVLFSDFGSALASDEPEREAATNVELLTLDDLKQRAEARLGAGTAATADVSVEQQGESNLLQIAATDENPRVAARTANAYAAEYVDFRQLVARREIRAEQGFLRRELGRLPAGSPRRDGIERRLRRLRFLESRERGGAQILSEATPPGSASSPKPVRNTIIGAVVGLVLALLAAILFERLDPRLTTPAEVEAALDGPVLGLIPKSRALARTPGGRGPPPGEVDGFLALRAHLPYLRPGHELRSVLITSSGAGDGKTTVAWNLACAAAGPSTRVLLVEADLRNPSLADALGTTPQQSITSVLDGSATLSEVIEDVAVRDSDPSENGQPPSRIVSVAFAGPDPVRSADPATWKRLTAAIREAEQEFDLIVIDTAPVLLVPDAIPLLSEVDGVIVIGRLGSTPRAALARLRQQLKTVDAPILGAIANAVGRDARYTHGYGDYGRRR